jgi:hypothetical protein
MAGSHGAAGAAVVRDPVPARPVRGTNVVIIDYQAFPSSFGWKVDAPTLHTREVAGFETSRAYQEQA